MEERENVLRIFEETKESLKRGDSAKIKSLSNQTINTASLTHDPGNIAAAVVVYSLSKILEREDYKSLPGWNKFYKEYVKCIDQIIIALKKKDDESARKYLAQIRKAISTTSGGRLKENITDVFRRASINKASRIYEHGISLERTAKLLGINMYELAEYAGGNKEITDAPENKTIDAKSRIKIAMEMFR
jgi:hypothetical protein